jgi:uncharacterized membrane protein
MVLNEFLNIFGVFSLRFSKWSHILFALDPLTVMNDLSVVFLCVGKKQYGPQPITRIVMKQR